MTKLEGEVKMIVGNCLCRNTQDVMFSPMTTEKRRCHPVTKLVNRHPTCGTLLSLSLQETKTNKKQEQENWLAIIDQS